MPPISIGWRTSGIMPSSSSASAAHAAAVITSIPCPRSCFHEWRPVAAPVTVTTLAKMKRSGERIACLTAYDASFANLLDEAGTEVLLVGDSLGMVVQGHDTTVPVTMDQMVYHCAAVARGRRRALLMA